MGEAEKARGWLNELKTPEPGVGVELWGLKIADEMQDYTTAETILSSFASNYSDQSDLRYRLAVVKFHAQEFEQSGEILQRLLNEGHKTSEGDRKSVVEGKSVDLGGRRIIKKKKKQ